MSNDLWYDQLWNPQMGFVPPLEDRRDDAEIVLFDFDPFVVRPYDRFHPDDVKKRHLIKNALAVCVDHPYKTFVCMTERPDLLHEFMVSRAKDYAAPQYKVNRLESLSVPFPPPNFVAATRIFDGPSAAQRIMHLWRTPAAKRMVVYDPIEPIDLEALEVGAGVRLNAVNPNNRVLDYFVVDARCTAKVDVNWIETALKQCNTTSLLGDGGKYDPNARSHIPCFVVKLGNNVWDGAQRLNLADKRGADWSEWQPNLKFRFRLPVQELVPKGM